MKEYDADGIDGPWIKAMEAPQPTRYDRLRKAYPRQHDAGVSAAQSMWAASDAATHAANADDAVSCARVIGFNVPASVDDAAVAYRLGFKRTWRKCQNKSGVTP